MSDAPAPTPTSSLRPTPAPAPRRGGFFGRLVAALLVVIITTFVALIAGAIGLLALGYTPETPRQLAEAQTRLLTAEALNQALLTQNGAMQTQVLDLTRRSDTVNETLGDLRREVGDLDRARQELAASASQNATLVADARASRDSVALFATAEAGRAALLDELRRRSERVERFLQRLSDISGDAAFDLSGGTPAVAAALTATPVPTATLPPTPPPTATLLPTATLPPTATPAPTATPLPTATAAQSGPSATPRASATARPGTTATP